MNDVVAIRRGRPAGFLAVVVAAEPLDRRPAIAAHDAPIFVLFPPPDQRPVTITRLGCALKTVRAIGYGSVLISRSRAEESG